MTKNDIEMLAARLTGHKATVEVAKPSELTIIFDTDNTTYKVLKAIRTSIAARKNFKVLVLNGKIAIRLNPVKHGKTSITGEGTELSALKGANRLRELEGKSPYLSIDEMQNDLQETLYGFWADTDYLEFPDFGTEITDGLGQTGQI